MDRVQNYNLQTPLTADDLNKERDYTAIALGKIVSALLGQGTVVSDLAATAVASTTVPTVQLSDGQLYELATLDPTAFGSLPVGSFPSTANVMKQGLLLASRGDTNTFELTPPGTSGESIIYLLEAQYADLDTDTQTITFYNVSDPTNPTTATQPRVREGTISFVLKAGIASSSPTAPSADAGYVPLYNIEVAYGQTVLSQSDITVASGAPFLSQKLFSLMNGSGTVDVPALTASGLITAIDGINVAQGAITARDGLSVPSGTATVAGTLSVTGTETVSGTLEVTGTVTIPNATANNEPVAQGQLLQTNPLNWPLAAVSSGTSLSTTSPTYQAPCNGFFFVWADGIASADANACGISASLSGFVLSQGTGEVQQLSASGYLPVPAGQSSTFTLTGTTSASASITLVGRVLFFPTP